MPSVLHWPFRQWVTLMLLDQDGSSHVVMSFLPDLPSPSFQRPSSEMNIVSACPTLLPLHILGNPHYVKDDTIFVKCSPRRLMRQSYFSSLHRTLFVNSQLHTNTSLTCRHPSYSANVVNYQTFPLFFPIVFFFFFFFGGGVVPRI